MIILSFFVNLIMQNISTFTSANFTGESMDFHGFRFVRRAPKTGDTPIYDYTWGKWWAKTKFLGQPILRQTHMNHVRCWLWYCWILLPVISFGCSIDECHCFGILHLLIDWWTIVGCCSLYLCCMIMYFIVLHIIIHMRL